MTSPRPAGNCGRSGGRRGGSGLPEQVQERDLEPREERGREDVTGRRRELGDFLELPALRPVDADPFGRRVEEPALANAEELIAGELRALVESPATFGEDLGDEI